MIDFCMTEGQLVMTHHGVPERAWAVPGGDGLQAVRVFREDMGGWAWCDVIVLSDGRTVLVSDDDGLVAAIYPSLAAAYDCLPNAELVEA